MTGEGMALCGASVLIKIGSLVQVLTADHPRDPALRRQGYEQRNPVSISKNVWIGSGAIIGSGNVVTRNVYAGAIAMGSRARFPDSREPTISIVDKRFLLPFALSANLCSQNSAAKRGKR